MREVAFDLLPALPLQSLAPFSPNAPPVAIHRFLFRLLAFPVARSPVGFRDVRPHLQFAKPDRDLVAVIPLICHYFSTPPRCTAYLPCGDSAVSSSATATPASITVPSTVAVSAAARQCVVTATIAPVSMSTAFSALYASAVRPSFSFEISASPSLGLTQSSLDIFFLRLRSICRTAAASLASTPSTSASRFRYSL